MSDTVELFRPEGSELVGGKTDNKDVRYNLNAVDVMSDQPVLANLQDVERYEQIPYPQRYPLQTGYEIIVQSGEKYSDDPVLQQLITAERDEVPEVVSFRQLAQRVTQSANAFHSLGVTPNDVVGILLTNITQAWYSTWGATAAGIAGPINPLLEARHIIEILNTTKAKVFVAMAPLLNDLSYWNKVQAVVEQVPSLTALMIVTVRGYTEDKAGPLNSDITVLDFNQTISQQPHDKLISNRKIRGDDTAAFFHTGGTTGRPKIAQVTHYNVAFITQMVQHLSAYKGRYTALSALPLFHIYGLVTAGIGAVIAGRCLVMMTPDGFRTDNTMRNWWHHAGRFKIKAFAAVPTVLSTLLAIPVGDADLSNLTDVGSGAAPLPKQLRREFEQRFGARVSNGYGMTETCALIARGVPENPPPDGSVGARIPYSGVRIVALNGNKVVKECGANEAGVLLVRGPQVFKGYLDKEDNDKAWVDGDWFNTGDLAFIDDAGFITLTGRAKDLIIRGGHNIDPIIIEEPLSKHLAVAEVVAIGQPDPHAGEIPVAYVRLKPEFIGKTTPDDLLTHCQQTISERAAIPKRIEILDALPVTAVGKVFKPELRNMATKHVLAAALQSAKVAGDIVAIFDPMRGQVAIVTLENQSDTDTARTVLAKFPVEVDFA